MCKTSKNTRGAPQILAALDQIRCMPPLRTCFSTFEHPANKKMIRISGGRGLTSVMRSWMSCLAWKMCWISIRQMAAELKPFVRQVCGERSPLQVFRLRVVGLGYAELRFWLCDEHLGSEPVNIREGPAWAWVLDGLGGTHWLHGQGSRMSSGGQVDLM